MPSIQLPRTLVNQILGHAQAAEGREICGLIGGVGEHPTHCYRVTNVADDPSRLYAMDPGEQIEAMRRMRDAGERLFAIYHSHPETPATPSARDLSLDGYPETLKLIVSLGTRGVLEMRAFHVRAGGVEEVALELEV